MKAGAARMLVMAKAPVPGIVKTRLRLPPEEAARLQQALILDTVRKARAFGPTTVAGSPPEHLPLIEPLLPEDVRLICQAEGNLGRRMLSGAETLFGEGPEPVLILGTDAPTLPPRKIEEASHALRTQDDVAIVPSEDGGYVLIGLREPYGALFSGIQWSTDGVYEQTLARARTAGLSVRGQDPWYDVDTPEDLARLEAELAGRPGLAPRTARALGI